MFIAMLAAATAEPLPPRGRWTVEYADSACMVSRQFGKDETGPALGIKLLPASRYYTFILTRSKGAIAKPPNKAAVLIGPSGRRAASAALSGKLPDGRRAATFTLAQEDLGDLSAAATLTIMLDDQLPIVLRVDNIAGAMKAAMTCTDDLQQRWQVDPGEDALIATPAQPIGDAASFITINDYPTDAIVAGMQGTAVIAWTIGIDGRVRDCHTVSSSGAAVLDDASCQALTQHGRYAPAIGKDGKPIASHLTRQVVWLLPQR